MNPPQTRVEWLSLLCACWIGLALLVAPGAFAGSLPGPGQPLRVVMDDDYPPFIFHGPGGALQGILVDQWALWEKRTGIPVRLSATTWAEAQRRLLEGEDDVIDTIFENKERERLYEFGPAYAGIDVPIFVSRDLAGIRGPGDLDAFIVGAKTGDSSVAYLRERGVTHFQLFPGYKEIVDAARDGRIKVFTVDKPPAMYYLIRAGIDGQFRETAPLYSGQFHRAVAKDRRDLLALVQRGFAAIRPEEYAAIDRKWYGKPLLSRKEVRRTAVVASMGLGVLAFLLGWIWVLWRLVARRTAELRAISANFANGMFYQLKMDTAGNRMFTYLSGSVPVLYGVPVEAALADANLIYGRLHPDDLASMRVAEEEAVRSLTTFKHEARVIGPDGLVRWSSFTSKPRRLANGDLLWDGVEFIITDRVRIEQALRASEAEYRSLLEAVPDLVFTFSGAGDYLSVNTSSPELLVQPAEAVLGRNVAEILPGPLAALLKDTIARVLELGSAQDLGYALEVEGEERHFEARMAPAASGRVIAVVRDVTGAKRLEREKLDLQMHLQQAQKLESLGHLAGGIAHDMNNVLGAILAIASANLELQPAGSRLQHAFGTIAKAATRGGETVRNLLNFARQAPVQTRELDLNALVRGVTQLLERTTLAKVRLELDLDPALRSIAGDESALANALMNLAVNAVDAMDGEGTLFIRTRNLDPGRVQVEVGDTGPGMAPEVLRRALDPFFTTKEVGKGTGLGLAIAYGTVKAHRGTLDISSSPGRGTWVVLRFPAGGAGQGAPAEPAGPSRGLQEGKLQVLLVDDDPIVNASYQALLAMLGHRVEAATRGEEALARVEGGLRPDVVLLDVNMPGLGAYGTVPRLRRLLPEVPIVLVTGKADRAVLDLVESHPRLSLLPKPFDLETLRRHLEALALPA